MIAKTFPWHSTEKSSRNHRFGFAGGRFLRGRWVVFSSVRIFLRLSASVV